MADEESNKKYITATLDKDADAKLILGYGRLQKIAGFSARDVFEAGVETLKHSPQYKEAIAEMKAELGE